MDDLKNLPEGIVPFDLVYNRLFQQGYSPLQIAMMYNNMGDQSALMGRVGGQMSVGDTNRIGAGVGYNLDLKNKTGALNNVDLNWSNPNYNANVAYDLANRNIANVGVGANLGQGQNLSANYNPVMKALQLIYKRQF